MKPDRAIRRAMKRRAQNELSGAISGSGTTFPEKLFLRMQDVAGSFLDEDEINILPYLLLPIMGDEDYDEEDSMGMLADLQLLPPDKKRDPDPTIMQTHLETLMLLTTTRKGRELMREIKVYPIIRETHARVNHEGVKEACDRLVRTQRCGCLSLCRTCTSPHARSTTSSP